jgi:hypothetical protein
MPKPKKSLEERFWPNVNKTETCWIWTACKNKLGYGFINEGGRGSGIAAYRKSWEIHYGEIPDGLHVLHKCDNPSCVNPEHLFLGTHLDNMRDMWTKGRGRCDGAGRKGSANGNSRLTWDQVNDIRIRVSRGETHMDISKIYGVTRSLIGQIANQKIWKTEEKRP